MADDGGEKLEEEFPPPSRARESMDLDLDLDASWPFDPAAFLSDSPPEFFPLSSSSLERFGSSSPRPACVVLEENATEMPASLPDISNSVPGNNSQRSAGVEAQPISKAAEEQICDVSCAIKGRMTRALRCFKETTDQHVLVQVWAPVTSGNRKFLTTSEQPFILDPHCIPLLRYRTASLSYLFSVDIDSDEYLGLPGRVFSQKVPEWTPDVQYYSSKEYPRLTHALNYNVKGSLALPVFEPFYESCIGVVELILTSPKINYATEIDKVCKALEVVNLKSTGILGHPKTLTLNESHQSAMSEILEIITSICETHKLPLGQTWVPSQRENLCLSTTNASFYIIEPQMWGFRDACQEHRLKEDQGVAGMAFLRKSPCFSSDITKFNKNSYPLVHYARMFGLGGCLAICIKSCCDSRDHYVVEFFLPTNCREETEQLTFSSAILTSVKGLTRNLKVVSDGEILLVDGDSDGFKIVPYPAQKSTRKSQSQTLTSTDVKKRGKAEKVISLEVLRTYFSGSLKEAAKSLGVCPTTMKRICRQHGISRWPSRKIKKVNRSLSRLKRVMESVQGTGPAFDFLPSLTGSWQERDRLDGLEREIIQPNIDLHTSKESHPSDSPDSQGSRMGINLRHPLKEPSLPEGLQLRNLCLYVNADRVNTKINASIYTVKVKASYRGEIIRFGVESSIDLPSLKEEMAKRLNLDVDEFDVKYLDDDGEWVLLSCNVDLEECIEFSGGHIIRMSIVDFSGTHERENSQSSQS